MLAIKHTKEVMPSEYLFPKITLARYRYLARVLLVISFA
jgi:hypothetical protein